MTSLNEPESAASHPAATASGAFATEDACLPSCTICKSFAGNDAKNGILHGPFSVCIFSLCGTPPNCWHFRRFCHGSRIAIKPAQILKLRVIGQQQNTEHKSQSATTEKQLRTNTTITTEQESMCSKPDCCTANHHS